ncbi:PDC sensor domain-containing protein [Campylobacter sp.]|uniref:PDC sensor domain-containing protein n=1 Tax=Campylobacter sp. TaxID=205 RepID=UPI002AA8B1BF|nr:PDC sensor domain-containing protein [Campylobacter sp.]MCI7581447.1 PDC sensor domain-containing protein [Campylobacter sp.]
MLIQDIRRFARIRYNARAYLAYLFERNIPNRLPMINLDIIKSGLDKIAHEVENFDAFYILAPDGVQIENNISLDESRRIGAGENRSNKAYFYRAVKERRCVLSDPYPSSLTGELCVSASEPVYDEKGTLLYIVCVDISLNDILKLIPPGRLDFGFENFSRLVYALISLALFAITAVLFVLGIKSIIWAPFAALNVADMFESTIVLTLALALFDLVKAIFDEEVLGKSAKEDSGVSRTMVRFLSSIIIALAIEALMLVFKFAITSPEQIVYAVWLISGVSLLLIALSVYLYMSKKVG